MKTNPQSEEDIKKGNLIKDGRYKALVESASDTDKNGNALLTKTGVEKIDAVFTLTMEDNSRKKVKCTLTPAYAKVLKHFCDATGLQDKYNSDSLTAEDCKGTKEFEVEVYTYSYTNMQGEEVYTNGVKDIFPIGGTVEKKDDMNDDITF